MLSDSRNKWETLEMVFQMPATVLAPREAFQVVLWTACTGPLLETEPAQSCLSQRALQPQCRDQSRAPFAFAS